MQKKKAKRKEKKKTKSKEKRVKKSKRKKASPRRDSSRTSESSSDSSEEENQRKHKHAKGKGTKRQTRAGSVSSYCDADSQRKKHKVKHKENRKRKRSLSSSGDARKVNSKAALTKREVDERLPSRPGFPVNGKHADGFHTDIKIRKESDGSFPERHSRDKGLRERDTGPKHRPASGGHFSHDDSRQRPESDHDKVHSSNARSSRHPEKAEAMSEVTECLFPYNPHHNEITHCVESAHKSNSDLFMLYSLNENLVSRLSG